MKYKIVLFDADGTLFDFKKCEYQALKKCLLEFGLRSDDECINRFSQINDMLWKRLERGEVEKERLVDLRFELLCKDFSFDIEIDKISKKYRENLAKEAYLIDGATDILDILSVEKRLFIITNGLASVQKGRFAASGLGKYFEEIFISEELGAEKPSLQFFDSVKSKIENFEADEAIVVGDSLTSDIMGGINAGIDTCWYNPSGKAVPKDMKIKYIIKDLFEFKEIIE